MHNICTYRSIFVKQWSLGQNHTVDRYISLVSLLDPYDNICLKQFISNFVNFPERYFPSLFNFF